MSIARPQRCLHHISYLDISGARLHYLHPKTLFGQRRSLHNDGQNEHGQAGSADKTKCSTSAPTSNKSLNQSAHWKPISKDGTRDLAQLAEAMSEMAANVQRQVRVAAKDTKQETEKLDASQQTGSWYQYAEAQSTALNIPTSPLEYHMAQKKWIPKREPTVEEKEKLARNPWAAMLASPLRQDASTKAKFPSALLTQFDTAENPQGKDVYLLPTDLADLEAFSQRLKTGNRNAAVRSRSSNSTETLRILPYQLLFEEMTDTFMVWRNDTMEGVTKANTVAKRLIPPRWQEKHAKHTAFSNASRSYWNVRAEKGDLDDDVSRPPEPVRDLSKVQWKASITERMSDIMRQRVLLSLNHLAKLQNVPNDQPQREEIHCMPWPKNGVLDLSHSHLYASSQTPAFWNDMGDIESPGALNGKAKNQGNSCETRPPIAIKPSEIPEDICNGNIKPIRDPSHWLPGSFIIHLGEPPNTLSASADPEGQLDGNSTYSKFIPPFLTTVSHPNYRLPVFNLTSLLGRKFDRTLPRVLDVNHAQFGSIPVDRNELNHIILVKAGSAASHFLAQELWQLWRYLGGRDCLVSRTSIDNTADDSKHRNVDARAMKAKTKYRGLSDKAWDQLGELLGLKTKLSHTEERSEQEARAEKED